MCTINNIMTIIVYFYFWVCLARTNLWKPFFIIHPHPQILLILIENLMRPFNHLMNYINFAQYWLHVCKSSPTTDLEVHTIHNSDCTVKISPTTESQVSCHNLNLYVCTHIDTCNGSSSIAFSFWKKKNLYWTSIIIPFLFSLTHPFS
jgi:hypothetical protein